MNEVAIQEGITKEKILEYLKTFGLTVQLSEGEAGQFVEVALAYGLNPFKREIYCVPYGAGDKRKLSIITGYETYLKRAERTARLDGWRVWTEGTIKPTVTKETIRNKDGSTWDKKSTKWEGNLKAHIEIHRKDWTRPFRHEVLFSEYVQDNPMWGGKPETMIKKVCTAQGFRLCFPDELGGMPYTSDELDDNMTTVGASSTEAPAPAGNAPDEEQAPVVAQAAPAPAGEAPAPGVADVQADYAKFRAKAIADVLAITGKPGEANAWAREEIDTIEGGKLLSEGRRECNKTPLRVLLLRAQIGADMKRHEGWDASAMKGIVAIGMDPGGLESMLLARTIAQEEASINAEAVAEGMADANDALERDA